MIRRSTLTPQGILIAASIVANLLASAATSPSSLSYKQPLWGGLYYLFHAIPQPWCSVVAQPHGRCGRRQLAPTRWPVNAAGQIVSAGWSRCHTLLCSSGMARWRPEAGSQGAATATSRRLAKTSSSSAVGKR